MHFLIHNTTRSPHTKEIRRQVSGPDSSTKNLYIGGGLIRVVRGRPWPVSESFVQTHRRELMDKESKGLLFVSNQQYQRLDLSTLTVVDPAPVAVPAEQVQVEPPPEIKAEESVEEAVAAPEVEKTEEPNQNGDILPSTTGYTNVPIFTKQQNKRR